MTSYIAKYREIQEKTLRSSCGVCGMPGHLRGICPYRQQLKQDAKDMLSSEDFGTIEVLLDALKRYRNNDDGWKAVIGALDVDLFE